MTALPERTARLALAFSVLMYSQASQGFVHTHALPRGGILHHHDEPTIAFQESGGDEHDFVSVSEAIEHIHLNFFGFKMCLRGHGGTPIAGGTFHTLPSVESQSGSIGATESGRSFSL